MLAVISELIVAGGCLACLGWAWIDSCIESWRRASRIIAEVQDDAE